MAPQISAFCYSSETNQSKALIVDFIEAHYYHLALTSCDSFKRMSDIELAFLGFLFSIENLSGMGNIILVTNEVWRQEELLQIPTDPCKSGKVDVETIMKVYIGNL